MKKNLPIKLAVVAVMMTLVTSTLVSGTYAKYVKEVSGADTARVAKFAFNLTDGTTAFADQSDTEEQTIDIFSYTDTGVYNDGVNSGKFIAPGTTGSFDLEVENLSEVDVAVSFGLTETNASNVPIYYTLGAGTQRYSSKLTGSYTGGGTYQTMAQLATAMNTAAGTLQASDGTTPTSTDTITIHWTWAFASAGTEQTDSADTALGVAGTATVKLAVAATVTQVD